MYIGLHVKYPLFKNVYWSSRKVLVILVRF